ncbi:hypothetical protein [Rubrolithibacter danxiaensis]|uniref:hypothetical protein n=1 Tax=Rubrolithibacter danxiaensis TaxID=3390805 RepID=UPI003BF7BA04
MLNKEEAAERITALLAERKNRVVGKNIVSAALSLFSNPAEAVEKLFFGVDKELSDEKLKFEQELMLELVCEIGQSLTNIQEQFESRYGKTESVVIDGLIEVSSKNSEATMGVHIKSNSGQVEFKPGTKITVKSEGGTGSTTGLKIGD